MKSGLSKKMQERKKIRYGESVCVCVMVYVCVREREREREGECVCVYVRVWWRELIRR